MLLAAGLKRLYTQAMVNLFYDNSFLWFIVNLFIAVWLYDDARKRKLPQPMVWFAVGLLLGVLGLATYWYWHVYGAGHPGGVNPDRPASASSKPAAKETPKRVVAGKSKKK